MRVAGVIAHDCFQARQPRQHRHWHLNASEVDATAQVAVFALKVNAHVQAQIRNEGEGPRVIHRQRRQNRKDFRAEIVTDGGALFGVEVAGLDEVDVFPLQQLKHFSPHPALPGDQRGDFVMYPAQQLQRGRAVRPCARVAQLQALKISANPHHVEFIQIVAHNGDELDALEQRRRLVLRQRQHPLLKVDGAQLSIDEVLGTQIRRQVVPCLYHALGLFRTASQ